jgi:hypothetical protein
MVGVRTNIPLDVVEDMGGGDDDRSDYRPVPTSDRGSDDGYRDRGMLGFYQTDAKPFKNPGDVRFFDGHGASMADLERGWCEPLITEHPAYEKKNYADRSTQPKESDITPGNIEAMPDDWQFRDRNRRSQGFLTRPRIPTERG